MRVLLVRTSLRPPARVLTPAAVSFDTFLWDVRACGCLHVGGGKRGVPRCGQAADDALRAPLLPTAELPAADAAARLAPSGRRDH